MDVRQCKMARAALGWSLDDLADASGVSRRTVAKFEAGGTILPENAKALRDAFEAKRVRFIDSGPFKGGVTMVRAG